MTRSHSLTGLLASVAVAVLVATSPTSAAEQKAPGHETTNVVLVHGAWADGSSWSKVIPLLEARGLHVVAVQLPLTSLADDVATVQRAIAGQDDGPLLLVGHSYGGVVITEAGNDPKVTGLVYVAAYAPLAGQSALDLATANPTPGVEELLQDQFGFLTLTPKGIREDFAQDLSNTEQTVLTATQSPTSGAALGTPVSTAAWLNKPSWYVVTARDRMIAPALQQALVQQINATAITLPSSHVAMLSHPHAVASFIRRAARESR